MTTITLTRHEFSSSKLFGLARLWDSVETTHNLLFKKAALLCYSWVLTFNDTNKSYTSLEIVRVQPLWGFYRHARQ